MRKTTKVNISKDEKGVEWIRASPVNLVVSISDNEVRIWTCKKGCEEGENIFRLKAKKKDGKWEVTHDG